MQSLPVQAPARSSTLTILLALSLLSSAIHFADNAFHLDLYPGPVWLTRKIILLAWPVVLAAAWLAYRSRSRWPVLLYSLFGFAGLAHYTMPHIHRCAPRCAITVGAEALTSALLLLCVLLHPGRSASA